MTTTSKRSSISKSAGITKRPPRSLASLSKCSAMLSAEARGISEGERGNVISHKPAVESLTDDANKKLIEGEGMATLYLSDDGTPCLKTKDVSSGPEVVDANDVIAVGVVGEDGRQVRFCEYSGEGINHGNGNVSSGRDRLEQRLNMEDDDDFDIHDEGGNNINDVDSNSSGSLANDNEILVELGLSELISEEEDEEGDQMNTDIANSENLRAFRMLWELLVRWATPSTVELVLYYQGHREHYRQENGTPPSASHEEEKASSPKSRKRNSVDVGASRMASIMSMLKINIHRSLSELKTMHRRTDPKISGTVAVIDERKVEQRLADLIRTFDPTAPAANLNTKMWRGLCTVLIAISFPSFNGGAGPATANADKDSSNLLPPSILTLNMSAGEYEYLTQSAIISLSSTHDLQNVCTD